MGETVTTIAIFGAHGDAEVDALAKRIRDRGAEPWIIDLSSFPERLAIEMTAESVRVGGRTIDEVHAAFLRTVGRNAPAHARYVDNEPVGDASRWSALYEETCRALRRERRYQSVRTSLVARVARQCPVVNPPHPQNLHREKPFELSRMAAAGLPVPTFLAGTDREALASFVETGTRSWGGVVNKPLAGIYKTVRWDESFRHPFDRRPALGQRLIRGDTVRCYVLDGRLISAARIVHAGTVDSSLSQTGIETIELSPEQRSLAEGTAHALGLVFCGMDLMVDHATAESWVIDCNLSPMFVNYAKLSGCDVPGHVADYLLRTGRGPSDRSQRLLDLLAEAKDAMEEDRSLVSRLRGRGGRR